MRGCTSSLLPVVEPRETTKQTNENWETSLTTAVLQPKTRRCGNNISCLICPHDKRFGAEQRTHERHETILTIVKYTRLACAMLKHPTRPERDPTNLQQHKRQQEHELTTTVKIRYAARATWYCTSKWHTNETQIQKKSKARRQREESVLNDKPTVKDVVPSTETTKWATCNQLCPNMKQTTVELDIPKHTQLPIREPPHVIRSDVRPVYTM